MYIALLATVSNLRRNPKFSLLSFVLTTMDGDATKRTISGIKERCTPGEICLLFGGYVATPSEEGDVVFERLCARKPTHSI